MVFLIKRIKRVVSEEEEIFFEIKVETQVTQDIVFFQVFTKSKVSDESIQQPLN
jgi:hypothetical protein